MTNVTDTAPARGITADSVQAHTETLIQQGVQWLGANWLQILAAGVAGTLIVVSLFALRNLGRRLLARPGAAAGWGHIFARALWKTSRLFIVMVSVRLVVGFADPPDAVTTSVGFLFTVAAVFQAAIWAREIVLGAIEQRTTGSDHATLGSAFGLIRVLVTFALFAIALIVTLDNLGVNVTGLVAGLGVGGIAIGLAAQGIFADLFAALAIIFDKPFRVGDSVSYGGSSGTVEAIGLKSTRVRGLKGEQRIIANKKLLDSEIENNTKRERRRTKFTLGLTYQTPPDVCEGLPGMLREIVEARDLIFVRAGFVAFGASSLDFEMEFETNVPDFQTAYDARHAVGLAILRRFNDEGIELAYPTQTNFLAAPDGSAVMPVRAE